MINKILKNIYIKAIISIFIWILYLEINPNIGGIWIRPDSNNNKKILLGNIVNFIKNTLHLREMWTINFLDVNFITANLILIIILTIIENYFLKNNLEKNT